MNIFHKVTLEILKKNKTRTIVTIIGILLSAAMFTAVTGSVSTVQNYLIENAYYTEGKWHVSVYETTEEFFTFLLEPEKIVEHTQDLEIFEHENLKQYVYSQEIGYAIAEGCSNPNKPYLYVIGANTEFAETMPVHLTEGRFPENTQEILLPNHLERNGGVHYALGDVLTLEIGNRMSEGYILGQHNPYLGTEEENQEFEYLDVIETRTYTVVGFYERPSFEEYSASGYTAITGMDKVRPEGARYDFYLELKNPKDAYTWFSEINRIFGYSTSTNSDLLVALGCSGYDTFYAVLYGLAAIVSGLIIFGSVSLIYNAFSISISERTKQFGLLSSIGATNRQIRKMVFFEALAVSVIGIPLGIVAGIVGMGITFHCIGTQFAKILNFAHPLELCIYPWTVVAACVLTLFTVLISAWIPSKHAAMVTAVEAIRQSDEIKLSKKERKNLQKDKKLMSHLFGLSGMLAEKYYTRSKRKYRATIGSLFMSIVLFISASAFTGYLTDSVESSFAGNGYDIRYSYYPLDYMSGEEIEQEDFSNRISESEWAERLEKAQGITEMTYVSERSGYVNISNEYLSKQYQSYMQEKLASYGVELEREEAEVLVGVLFVEDTIYETFLEEQNLDKETYMNVETPLGVAIDESTFFDYELEKYIQADLLKEDAKEVVLVNTVEVRVDGIEISEKEEMETNLQIGAIVKERPYYVSDAYQLSILYPYSAKERVELNFGNKYNRSNFYILTQDHATTYEDLEQIVKKSGCHTNSLYDYAETVEENRALVLIIQVFSYGFIVLISLIAAANVFNTISTNIRLRRREFAMLKSVGMSDKDLQNMMNVECLLYGSRAIVYGIPVSILITWLIYRVISEGFSTGFYLPYTAIAIAIFSVFAVVFSTMVYSMKKIQQDNPIDALKNENL